MVSWGVGLLAEFVLLLFKLLVHCDGVAVVLDRFLILPQQQLHIGLQVVMLDHVIVAQLNRLSYIVQRRLIPLQFIVNDPNQVQDLEVLLIAN